MWPWENLCVLLYHCKILLHIFISFLASPMYCWLRCVLYIISFHDLFSSLYVCSVLCCIMLINSLCLSVFQCSIPFNEVLLIYSKSRLSGQSIYLFTCRDDPHAGDEQKKRQASRKVHDLKEAGIVLEIMHMGQTFNVNKFYKVIICIQN